MNKNRGFIGEIFIFLTAIFLVGGFLYTQTDPDWKTKIKDLFDGNKLEFAEQIPPVPPELLPDVDVGPDMSIKFPTNSVTLSGKAKSKDGSPLTYNWFKLTGGIGTIVSPFSNKTVVKGLKNGKYRGKEFKYVDQNDFTRSIDPSSLPDNMVMYIDADVGENSNSNMVKKMDLVGSKLIPALQSAGAGGAVNPAAAVRIACTTLEALDLDPLDFLVDYTDPVFLKKAEEDRKAEALAMEKKKQLEEQVKQLDLAQRQATINLTNIQAKNAIQDNTKQLMVALDKSYQEWAKLYIDAAKEGVELPPQPKAEDLLAIAQKVIRSDLSFDASSPAGGIALPSVSGPAAALEGNNGQVQA
jgi:hypothetical protein